MVDINVVCAALANQIGTYARPALRSLPEPEDSVTPPVGVVMPGNPYVVYGQTLEGATGWLGDPSLGEALSPRLFNLDYIIAIAKASTLDRQEAMLNSWLGFQNDAQAVSVVAAVAVDPTLGGIVEWCVPTSADRPGPLDWNGLMLFGTRIHFNLSAA